MFCPKCGTENPEDSNFCRRCGSRLGKTFTEEFNVAAKDLLKDRGSDKGRQCDPHNC